MAMHLSAADGNTLGMNVPTSQAQGIIVVLDEEQTRAREASLGTALRRLSHARELRGPVSVLDPFAVDQDPDSDASALEESTRRRSGIFSFSHRGRDAVQHHLNNE